MTRWKTNLALEIVWEGASSLNILFFACPAFFVSHVTERTAFFIASVIVEVESNRTYLLAVSKLRSIVTVGALNSLNAFVCNLI